MNLFRDLSRKPGGLIAGYGLSPWWQGSLDNSERSIIRLTVDQPLGAFHEIDSGNPRTIPRMTSFEFLASLSSWFLGPKLRSIGRKIAAEAEQQPNLASSDLDLHFAFTNLVNLWMRSRKEDPDAEHHVMEICEKMLSIEETAAKECLIDWQQHGGGSDLPTHVGFEAVCKLYAAYGQSDEAARFARQAQMRGWQGNWEKWISKPNPH